MTLVVDASAIGALLFGEPEKPWVEAQTDDAELIAPSLLIFELGNICWKKLQRLPAQVSIILPAWNAWCASSLVRAEPTDPVQTILLARDHGLTFYDASYLWLARYRTADLVSLDVKLVCAARTLGLRAPMPRDRANRQTTPRSRS